MNILCEYTSTGPAFVRSGWGRVFEACDHRFYFWDPRTKSAFDAFNQTEPDIFLGTTYGLNRAIIKLISRRPEMKVGLYASAWGPYLNDLDLKRYPIVVVGEEEKKKVAELKKTVGKPDFVFFHAHGEWLEGIMSEWSQIGVEYKSVLNAIDTFIYLGGSKKEYLEANIGFVGGYWDYKSRNLNRYIVPLCHESHGLNIKIFGHGRWPVIQHLGFISDKWEKDLFVSATVCPNISEPHSTDFPFSWDVVERPFKVMGAGGFCISDYVPAGRDLFNEQELPMAKTPDEFFSMVKHFIKNPDERLPFIDKGRKKVLFQHTYWDRVADMFSYFGMPSEREKCLCRKAEVITPYFEAA